MGKWFFAALAAIVLAATVIGLHLVDPWLGTGIALAFAAVIGFKMTQEVVFLEKALAEKRKEILELLAHPRPANACSPWPEMSAHLAKAGLLNPPKDRHGNTLAGDAPCGFLVVGALQGHWPDVRVTPTSLGEIYVGGQRYEICRIKDSEQRSGANLSQEKRMLGEHVYGYAQSPAELPAVIAGIYRELWHKHRKANAPKFGKN